MSFKILLFVGFGGFFGAILRFVISQISLKILPMGFATLMVNILGSFLMGLILSYSSKISISVEFKMLITAGFLGALTTFSTFAYENIVFLEQGKIATFFLNIATNVCLSILACYVGVLIFK
ncbi:putative fluoride ion transporter [Campylobacter blaseri]|uniref:Fluoride-specific ion channel FluC n=1 Tax=Campylobacter blaseri TaxID=2042961 RepID=A0A2P8R465_9BACT|nr:fluoride efflux transporter CrcB [Campylobacter blaseri]PSM53286.1 fluoride efflux transporter CrcB [Campylobacter blaseri]PSM54752.1 fluoride efflux transporter CrcB [Campylobacter blaseri]QKF86766.1 putative fluoride ion transporter [Campylobacter blaseri]